MLLFSKVLQPILSTSCTYSHLFIPLGGLSLTYAKCTHKTFLPLATAITNIYFQCIAQPLLPLKIFPKYTGQTSPRSLSPSFPLHNSSVSNATVLIPGDGSLRYLSLFSERPQTLRGQQAYSVSKALVQQRRELMNPGWRQANSQFPWAILHLKEECPGPAIKMTICYRIASMVS